jgi:hypothetical protein
MDQLVDPLATQLPREIQIQAARLAQDGFARSFRLTLEMPVDEQQRHITETAKKLTEWTHQTTLPEQSTLCLAMILSGLDQWGLAFSQTFGATAMAGLSELVSQLRITAGETVTTSIEQIDSSQAHAFTFKAELRKAIHLALWHAMIEEDDHESAAGILQQMGGMMLRLLDAMPDFGWIIVAHTLADIQIRCLAHGLATTGLPQKMTQELFGALNQQLPADQREKIMSGATQTVIAWQQSTRDKTKH